MVVMANPATVAYVREDGSVEAHESRWGGHEVKLLDEIDSENEYAGGAVYSEPYWTGDSLEEWAAEAVDFFHHEACYAVDEETWDVRAFVTVRWPHARDDLDVGERGALVEVADADEYAERFDVSEYEVAPETPISESAFVDSLAEQYGDAVSDFSPYAEEVDSQ